MSIDNSRRNNHNLNRDDENENYEEWHIDRDNPVNDPNCQHFFVLDGEEIGNRVAWSCNKCKRGVFLPKGQKIINS